MWRRIIIVKGVDLLLVPLALVIIPTNVFIILAVVDLKFPESVKTHVILEHYSL